MEELTDVLGYAGAVFLTCLTYPQVWHCYRRKSTEGVPWAFLFFEFMTSACFLAYGILLPSLPVILANAAAFVGAILLIVAKILYPELKRTSKSAFEVNTHVPTTTPACVTTTSI